MKMPLWLRRVSVVAYCALVYYLSSRSEYPDVQPWFPGWAPDPSIIAHFFLYAVFAIAAWNNFRAEPAGWLSRRATFFAIVFCALYGVTDEYHQSFVPNRQCTFADFATDTIGAAAGMAFITLMQLLKKNKKRLSASPGEN
jgi:VanZ family protein